MKKFDGIIYMIVNCVNGKKYIGRDSYNDPNYLGGGVYLEAAQKKYGRGNFIKLTLRHCFDKADLIKWEQYYLDLYSVKHNYRTYNKATNAISGGNKDGKRVFQYDLKGSLISEFSTIKEAADSVGVRLECVRSAILRNGSSCDYYWSYSRYDSLETAGRKHQHKTLKDIYMYAADGLFLKSFTTMEEAGKYVGVHPTTIRQVLLGNKKSSKGYFWSYDEYTQLPPNLIERLAKKIIPAYGYNNKGECVCSYDSVMAAALDKGVDISGIYKSIQTGAMAYGLNWAKSKRDINELKNIS